LKTAGAYKISPIRYNTVSTTF